jgi:hypothetical protein
MTSSYSPSNIEIDNNVVLFVSDQLAFWEENIDFISFAETKIIAITYLSFLIEIRIPFKAIAFDISGFHKNTCDRLIRKAAKNKETNLIFIGYNGNFLKEHSTANNCHFLDLPFSSNQLREVFKSVLSKNTETNVNKLRVLPFKRMAKSV